jgi:hypothetical protein
MRRTALFRWTLLTALLLVQGLTVAHSLDHPALDHADHPCVVCAHGQGLDFLPSSEAPQRPQTPVLLPSAQSGFTGAPSPNRFHFDSRAPPALR